METEEPVKVRLWEYPANYSNIRLEEERGGQPVWQVVKRPLSKAEMDRLKEEAEDRQKKRLEKLQAEQKKLATEFDDEEATVFEEDEEVYVPEKFHYYWRLSAPNAYQKAGAVGPHWRPILLCIKRSGKQKVIEAKTLTELETEGNLHWLKEARLQQKLGEGTLGTNLLIFDKDFNETSPQLFVNKIKVIDEEKGSSNGYDIKFPQFQYLLRKWSTSVNLAGRALRASTPDDLIKAQPQGGIQEENAPFPFCYPSGAFVNSKNALVLAPTTWKKPERVRLYVKLRSERVGLGARGGIDDFTVDDVFIAKEVIERMSGATFELDPTRNQLESDLLSEQWPADERDWSMAEEKDDTGKGKEDKEGRLPLNAKVFPTTAFKDMAIWARNSMGFAFQYKYKTSSTRSNAKVEDKTEDFQVLWDTIRRKAIGSLEREGGWMRYIDPAIPLYIVPTSLEEKNNMHMEVLQAMKDLDMNDSSIYVDEVCRRKGDNLKLPKLRRLGAVADCATTKVYLVTRDWLKEMSEQKETAMKHLALSPFGHYETWIEKPDWDAYVATRPNRTEVTWALDQEKIEDARKRLRPKKDEVAVLEEAVRKAVGMVRKLNLKGQLAEKELKARKEQKTEVGDWQKVWAEVSATKILLAIGKREKAKSQAAVMGGSATLVAKRLQWKQAGKKTKGDGGNWPDTSHMPAEWLHRVAFSWGGIENNKDPQSSQDKKNLIFGSGECNSVMTRYEKAWQAMVRKEGHRFKPADEAEAALWKKKKNGKDGAGELFTWTERDEYPAEYGFNYKDNGWGKAVLIPQPMTAKDQVEHLPSWLSYSLRYKLVQKDDVLPFGEGIRNFETIFYPWQRGFFTKFEQKLDEMVLESAYTAFHAKSKDIVTAKVNPGGSRTEVVNIPGGTFEGFTGMDVSEKERIDKEDPDATAREMLKGGKKGGWRRNKKVKPNGGEPVPKVDDDDDEEEPLGAHRNDVYTMAAASVVNLEPTRVRITKIVETSDEVEALDSSIVETSDEVEALDSSVPQPSWDGSETAPQVQAVWEQVHAPGPTLIDGLVFANAEIVGGGSSNTERTGVNDGVALDSETHGASWTSNSAEETAPALEVVFDSLETTQTSTPSQPLQPPTPVPERFVVKAKFKLFNKFPADIYSLHDARLPHLQHYRVNLPKELSLGALLPSQSGSDLDAIALRDTTLEYRSHGTATGLCISTDMTLSGLLQPVSALLRDVFGQDRPRISISGVISSSLSLVRPPEPLGFTLRGELPEVNVPDLFGVLTVTHIGLDVMGSRRGSAGGYDLSYAFFGRGRVDASTAVEWRIARLGKLWKIAVQAESGEWKNVAGVDGVHLTDVFMEAAWMGTKLSTVRLDLRATFSIKEQATLMLQGKFARNDFEVAGYLAECSLTTLKQLYNQIFGAQVDVTTDHDIVLSSLVLVVSKSTTSHVTLFGAVSVDGHSAAETFIELGGGLISFRGRLDKGFSVGTVDIIEPALDVTIHTSESGETGRGFQVQLSGTVAVADKHRFDVAVYLSKTNGEKVEYAVYGGYEGELCLHDLMSVLDETDLLRDVKMGKIAVCVSNMENPGAVVKFRPPGYDIGKGLTVYAEVDLPMLKDVLGLGDKSTFIVCAAVGPPSEKGNVKISIRVPDVNAFTIQGFSVKNIHLAVAIVNAQPTVAIGGDLSFPVEDQKQLTLGLGLSAGVYEARGEAELKTPWTNPFNLNQAVVIHNFKAGLGILYAGATPSSVTLAGAVSIGRVSGSVLVHTGVDASKQLLHVKVVNLDVVDLLDAVGKLMGIDLSLTEGSKKPNDAFFIRKLEIYLSSGLVVFGKEYPKGIAMEADMTLFGKRAMLKADVSTGPGGKAVFTGSVERFKLGPLVVCAASDGNKDPFVHIELSEGRRLIRVDGKIMLGDSWLMLFVKIDSGTGEFEVYFQFVAGGDALKIDVWITLEGGLPQAKQDRLEQVSDGQGGLVWQPQNISLPQGGLLDGKTLTVKARVEQNIVDYLMKLANDNLGGERNPAEEQALRDAFNKAESKLRDADTAWYKAEDRCKEGMEKVTSSWDARVSEIKERNSKAQKEKADKVAKLDQEERDLIMKAAQEERELTETEKGAVAAAEKEALDAAAQVELWRVRVGVLEAAELALQGALNVLDTAEAQLSDVEMAVIRHEQTQPDKNGVAYEPWSWTAQELAARVELQEAKVRVAKDSVKVVQDGVTKLDMGSLEEATGKLDDLTDEMKRAEQTAKDRRAAVDDNMEAARVAAREKREALQKRRAAVMAHADKTIQELTKQETTLSRERSEALATARAQYDVNGTPEGQNYGVCYAAKRAAEVELNSYLELKNSVSSTQKMLLAPLRFTVNALGKVSKKILNIKSIVIEGQLSDNSGHVGCTVDCTVGGFDYTFTLKIDLGNIVSLFSALWEKIKGVISSVANGILNFLKKGFQAFKDFAEKVGKGIQRAGEATLHHFMSGLAASRAAVEDMLKDIDDKMIKPFKDLGDRLSKEFNQLGHDVVNKVAEFGADLERELKKSPDEIVRDIAQGAATKLVEIGFLVGVGSVAGQGSVYVGNSTADALNHVLAQARRDRDLLYASMILFHGYPEPDARVFPAKLLLMEERAREERVFLRDLHQQGLMDEEEWKSTQQELDWWVDEKRAELYVEELQRRLDMQDRVLQHMRLVPVYRAKHIDPQEYLRKGLVSDMAGAETKRQVANKMVQAIREKRGVM